MYFNSTLFEAGLQGGGGDGAGGGAPADGDHVLRVNVGVGWAGQAGEAGAGAEAGVPGELQDGQVVGKPLGVEVRVVVSRI